MKKKYLIIALVALAIAALGFILNETMNSDSELKTEKQLYTCGMHPQIIEDHPGDCPICGMKLVPVKNSTTGKSQSGERKILYWRAPMDANEIYDHPGKSKMGMDLVPVYEDGTGNSGIVKIDPAVVQNMNVKIVPVEEKNLSSIVTTNGVLKSNEKKDYIVTTRTGGWIEKLYVNYTGEKVSKGEKLMDIYSPELVSAQQELLTALSYNNSVNQSSIKEVMESGNELVKNAVRKLQLLEVPERDIEKLKETKEIKTNVTLYARSSGTVISKDVLEGQKINAGMPLLQVSDLSNLWLVADVYEYELSKIDIGSPAKIKFNYLPGQTFDGKVSFIYPTLDPKSRTVKVRLDINNYSGKLKPEMYASVEISGKEFGLSPVVPENAVIRSGAKDIVILSLGDGKFKPQPVTLGGYSNGYYQVIKGLTAGSKIVSSAQFMIDSESNLKSAIGMMQDEPSSLNIEDLRLKDGDGMDDTNGKMENGSKVKNEKGQVKDENGKVKLERKTELKNEKAETDSTVAASIVREGVIDLQAIDKNKDGKLYQDQMDWNVISDVPGKCPLCGMTLKELPIAQVRKNLEDNGFKAKK